MDTELTDAELVKPERRTISPMRRFRAPVVMMPEFAEQIVVPFWVSVYVVPDHVSRNVSPLLIDTPVFDPMSVIVGAEKLPVILAMYTDPEKMFATTACDPSALHLPTSDIA
jgi:hypothetical protein